MHIKELIPFFFNGDKSSRVKLYAPIEYVEATSEERKIYTNGCGPKGYGLLIPDTIYFLSISEACNIHDWMYHFGERHNAYKVKSDRAFLNNMIRIIDGYTKWQWLKEKRMKRAHFYYEKVVKYGGPSYWRNKNKECDNV